MIPQVDTRLVFIHFLEEIEDTKKHFEIIWPLPLQWFKVSQNLGATAVALVVPVNTSLKYKLLHRANFFGFLFDIGIEQVKTSFE